MLDIKELTVPKVGYTTKSLIDKYIERKIKEEIGEKNIMIDVELVSAEDVRGRGGVKGKGKYSKYKEGLGPHIDWFKAEIEKSADGKIRLKHSDILNLIGNGVGKNPTSVYWGVRYTLFQEGLAVSQGTHRDGSDLLIMRMAKDDDTLPISLSGIEVETDKDIETGIKK